MSIIVCGKANESVNELLAMLRGRGLLAVSKAINQLNNERLPVEYTRILVLVGVDVAELESLNTLVGLEQMVVVAEHEIVGRVKQFIKCDMSVDGVGREGWLLKLTQVIEHLFYIHNWPLTKNEEVRQLYGMARKAAVSNASILIEGETGTGKELMARYIHHHSKRAAGPFVAINCAAIPQTMIEAVLFGYEKGAFTNAVQRYVGKFEQADGGTIFLDEIAEMSLDLQSKLLRVLQESEVERIGSREVKKVDIKVVAATNKNLKEYVDRGLFRADLYYRINVVNLTLLPLVSRKQDIKALCDYFIELYSCENGLIKPILSNDALDAMMGYGWPGNIREMQNKIHRAVILNDNGVISVKDLALPAIIQDGVSLRSKEAEIILSILKETKGHRNEAAKRLMISPRTLRHKIMKLKESGVVIP